MTYVIIDGGGFQGLGAAPAVTDPMLRKQIIELGIVTLTKSLDAAKKASQRIVDQTPLFSQLTIREWRTTFVQQIEAMVVRCLTVGSDGVFPFERNPKLLETIAGYIESETKNITASSEELLSIAGGLRQASAAIATQSVDMLKAAVTAVVAAAKEADSSLTWLVLLGIGGLGAAYVWRSFR